MSLTTNAELINIQSDLPGNGNSLSDDVFSRLRKFIYDNCGIYFQDNKKYLLESRLTKRINYLGLSSFDDYLDYLKLNGNYQQEKRYLYEAITINETFFFQKPASA